MTDFTRIRIIDIDETNPPIVRKENYIDLYFKLSTKAPSDWCDDFNSLGQQIKPPAKVDPKSGLIIKTYVHDMLLIQQQLDKLKQKVRQCNEAYIEKLHQKKLALAQKHAQSGTTDSRQNQLDKILTQLIYEE